MKKQDRNLIIGTALGSMLNPLNTSMIAVALHRIQDAFHLSYLELSWIISSYYLVSAIAQPFFGKLGDQTGRRRVFLFGLLLVTISSTGAPLSPNYGTLLFFRILQALGTSAMMPNGAGIVRHRITHETPRAMALMSQVSSLSAAFGPFLGGLLLGCFDWQSLFLVNFPFLLASAVLVIRSVPRDEMPFHLSKIRFDLVGLLLFAISISLLLAFFLTIRTGLHWSLVLLALIGLAAFVRYENKHSTPFVDVRFLRTHRIVSLLYAQNLLANIVFYALLFGLPSYLQGVRQTSSVQTGLLMLSLASMGLVVTPFVGRWIARRGSMGALWTGTAVGSLGLLLLLGVSDTTPIPLLVPCLLVLGIGNSMSGFSLQMALYEVIHPRETGIATGLFMTARFTGTIFCSSLLGMMFGKCVTTERLHLLVIACIGFTALIALLMTQIRHHKNSSRTQVQGMGAAP